jgi:predicted methyltransferase
MIKFVPLFLWLTIVLTSVGCGGGLAKVDVARVITSGRDGWQHPERVMEVLDLRPGDRVAEIGAGSGYWIARLAEAVGPTGRVYAVEVEPGLVGALEEWVAHEGFDNVEVVYGAYDDPGLPDGAIDVAMTCLTYHHIEDRVVYFRRLHADLSPGARIVHLDDRPDAPAPISWFQSSGHWTEPALIASEMREAGYVRVAAYDFLPAQSFQVFALEDASPDTFGASR